MNRIVLVFVTIMITVAGVSASPVINNVTLNTTTPEIGASILVTVNATSDIGVTNVTASGVELVNQTNNIWNGTITALAGTHAVRIVAKDISGNVTRNNSVRYSAEENISVGNKTEINATIIVKPNRLNLDSNGKFTIFVILPRGIHVKDINLDTVEVQGVSAIKAMSSHKKGGTLILKYNRASFIDIIGDPQIAKITVTGYLNDGTYFEGSDTLNSVKVIDNHNEENDKTKEKDNNKEDNKDNNKDNNKDGGNGNNNGNNHGNGNGNGNRAIDNIVNSNGKENHGNGKSKNE